MALRLYGNENGRESWVMVELAGHLVLPDAVQITPVEGIFLSCGYSHAFFGL